ncbi:MAG: hypothetical protein IH977_05285 [Nitrospinae bacterium]|nr:hypothetical protein [Nitrospinota bacterium]
MLNGKSLYLVRQVNKTPLAKKEMIEFIQEAEKIPRRDRCFQTHAIIAVRFFERNTDKAMSAIFRMEALSRLLNAGPIHGWTKDGKKKGSTLVSENIFAAAGQTPVHAMDRSVGFKKVELLKKAFELGRQE